MFAGVIHMNEYIPRDILCVVGVYDSDRPHRRSVR